jgi:hypothetical protein
MLIGVDANRDLNITTGITGLPVRIYIESLGFKKVTGFLFFLIPPILARIFPLKPGLVF